MLEMTPGCAARLLPCATTAQGLSAGKGKPISHVYFAGQEAHAAKSDMKLV